MKNFVLIIAGLLISTIGVGGSLWSITPLTPTSIAVPMNGSAIVSYRVTNNTKKTYTLGMTPIKGVVQVTNYSDAESCATAFVLSPQKSCVLTLQVNGALVYSGSTGGPIICEVKNKLQCYRPAAENVLRVNLTAKKYMLGGVVSGLDGAILIQNNMTSDYLLTENGYFTFPESVADRSSYSVTIHTQPVGQACLITQGTGVVNNADVHDIMIQCQNNLAVLEASIFDLGLAVNGKTRKIIIKNTGNAAVKDLLIDYPVFPNGTTAESTCTNFLAPGDSCVIMIHPGPHSTSNCNHPYARPIPGVITVTASNALSSLKSQVSVIDHGCIYQQGYVYSIDDSTSDTVSIGGMVMALENAAEQVSSFPWYQGDYVLTGSDSLINGEANTDQIINIQRMGNYAATVCTGYSIDSLGYSPCIFNTCYKGWFLPAICQLGAEGEGAGCENNMDNVVSNLPELMNGCEGSACLRGCYWSSTEFSREYNWYEDLNSPYSPSQSFCSKINELSVRCFRRIS